MIVNIMKIPQNKNLTLKIFRHIGVNNKSVYFWLHVTPPPPPRMAFSRVHTSAKAQLSLLIYLSLI